MPGTASATRINKESIGGYTRWSRPSWRLGILGRKMMRDTLALAILGIIALSFPIIFISLTSMFPLFALTKWDLLHVAGSLGCVNLFHTIPAITALMIVFTYSRFMSDAVVMTIQSAGSSLLASAMPGLTVAIVMMMAMLSLSNILVPLANRNIHDMLQFLRRNMDFSMLDAGRYYDFKYEGITLFFEAKDRSGRLKGLFLNERLPPDQNGVVKEKIYHAREAFLVGEPNEKRLLMVDGGALIPQISGDGTDIVKFENLIWRPHDEKQGTIRSLEHADELPTRDLYTKLKSELNLQTDKWPALGELVKRFTYPFITLSHSLLGLGIMLSMSSPTGRGRSTISAIIIASLLILFFHLIFLFMGESISPTGITSVQMLFAGLVAETSLGLFLILRGAHPRWRSASENLTAKLFRTIPQDRDVFSHLRDITPSALLPSSYNFLRFGRMTPNPEINTVWRIKGSGALTAIKELEALGEPHALFAVDLEAGSVLLQRVDHINRDANSYVLRVKACSKTISSGFSFVLRSLADNSIIHKAYFELHRNWQSCRSEFSIPQTLSADALMLEIIAGNEPIRVTNVRLVTLEGIEKKRAIRFHTRGNIALPSTRLRAVMIADYLDLLGWKTSINSGHKYDILFCQKTTPWIRMIIARLRGKQVIYDIDDDELTEGLIRRIRVSLFARLVSRMTVGSVHLQRRFSRYQKHISLLENPVDVMDPDIIRNQDPWRDRLVWFGMPENLWMLKDLKIKRPVLTITKGGAIPFDVLTIDRHLLRQDLALLPVSLNDYTRAKNANRLLKCISLGLPFLASDTEENRRALQAIGLSDQFLVSNGENWDYRIERVAQDYEQYRDAILAARPALLSVYGVEAVALNFIDDTLKFEQDHYQMDLS